MDNKSIMNITQFHIKKAFNKALHSQDMYVKIVSFAQAKGIFECSLSLLSDTEYSEMLKWWKDIKNTYSRLILKTFETEIETGDF